MDAMSELVLQAATEQLDMVVERVATIERRIDRLVDLLSSPRAREVLCVGSSQLFALSTSQSKAYSTAINHKREREQAVRMLASDQLMDRVAHLERQLGVPADADGD